MVAAQNKTTEAGITEFLASVELACVACGFCLGALLVASQAVRITVLKRQPEITAIESAVTES